MTNQTDIRQNISSGVPFSPQADLPPLPPEFQNLTTPTAQESNQKPDSGSATPPVPEFSNITANPKKKFGTGKIIATILGVLALVGSIGAGTYLIGQKQIFQQKAATGSCSGFCSTNGNCPEGAKGDGTGKNGGNGCDVGQYCCIGPTPKPSSNPNTCDSSYLTAKVCQGKGYGTIVDSNWTSDCQSGFNKSSCPGKIALVCRNTSGTLCAANCECGSSSTPTPTPTPTPNCSACFTKTPNYNKLPSRVGPFTASGKLVIYYVGSGTRTVDITTSGGISKSVSLNASDKARVVTDISINSGDTITINKITESSQGSPFCAPIKGSPYLAIGWMPINSNQTCGSGLSGPQTDGKCTVYQPIDESGNITWAQAFNDPSFMEKQCWADWQEWPGDYDFDDFFLMYAVTPGTSTPTPTPTPTDSPVAPYCAAIHVYDADWNVIPTADLSKLVAGTTINFCVTGAAPSGTFDMARFTINGNLQSDTTDLRPGSTDICQPFSIPENTDTFAVSAQIHHTTLGWF